MRLGYSNKTWCCPFFKWDEKLCVHCEGGRAVFPDMGARADYINRYCADVLGWKKCSLAGLMAGYYERERERTDEKD